MALYEFFPLSRVRIIDTDGEPVAGAKLYAYAGGAFTVAQDTYSTSTGTANANPVVTDADGLFANPIFLIPGVSYNFRLKSSDGGTTYWDIENYGGPNYSALLDQTFILKNTTDPTKKLQLLLSGISTGTTRTLIVPNADDTIAVLAAAQTLSNKSITNALGLQLASGIIQLARGSDVIAANDITLPVNGNFLSVTGATQINRLTTAGFQTGSRITLWFASTPTVKHNQGAGSGFYPILLNGSGDFVAAANMMISLVCIAGVAWIEDPRRS